MYTCNMVRPYLRIFFVAWRPEVVWNESMLAIPFVHHIWLLTNTQLLVNFSVNIMGQQTNSIFKHS